MTPDELPSNVIDGITKTLDVVSNPSKENLLEAAQVLLPHIKKVFYSKLQDKTAQLGKGIYKMHGKGTAVDNKVLALVAKKIKKKNLKLLYWLIVKQITIYNVYFNF